MTTTPPHNRANHLDTTTPPTNHANYKSTSPWSSTPSPNPELDTRDLDTRDLLAEARHFWLEGPDGEVISTLRLVEQHAGGVKVFTIGRVCIKKSTRGHGHTNRPLQAALADVRVSVPVNVQTFQEEMCGSHGFIRDGADFLDDRIPHAPMVKP
jgi:ElaA protein